MSTCPSTEPRLYFFLPPLVAATSTASEIAIPREPCESGCSDKTFLPNCVLFVGLAKTWAPKFSMMMRLYGF